MKIASVLGIFFWCAVSSAAPIDDRMNLLRLTSPSLNGIQFCVYPIENVGAFLCEANGFKIPGLDVVAESADDKPCYSVRSLVPTGSFALELGNSNSHSGLVKQIDCYKFAP
jgi:hypothetical protein